MKKIILFLLVILSAAALLNCPSTPTAVDEPTPTPELTATPEPTEEIVGKAPIIKDTAEPISDEEVQTAQNAIARAEEIEATTYALEELREAKTALEEALKVKESDPEAARTKLATSKEKADSAYDKSSELVATNYNHQLNNYKDKLLEIEGDKYRKKEYTELILKSGTAKKHFMDKKIVEGINTSDETIRKMAELLAALDDKIKWVRVMKQDVEMNLEQGEELEAYLWTPEKLENINDYYFKGVNAMGNYKIDEAEEYIGTAKELSIDMLTSAVRIKKEKETENAKNEALNLLEEASKLNIETDEGEIIEADPINIEEFLESVDEELKKKNNEPEPQALLNLNSGKTIVLGEVTKDNLLLQAKELIKKGIQAEQDGNLENAKEYYTQAQNYLKLYKAQSVKQMYTVRLIPGRRDCLWRIAEYDFVYENAFLWPLIWRRNRKLIQNPNLIHPGWQLIIPEQ